MNYKLCVYIFFFLSLSLFPFFDWHDKRLFSFQSQSFFIFSIILSFPKLATGNCFWYRNGNEFSLTFAISIYTYMRIFCKPIVWFTLHIFSPNIFYCDAQILFFFFILHISSSAENVKKKENMITHYETNNRICLLPRQIRISFNLIFSMKFFGEKLCD